MEYEIKLHRSSQHSLDTLSDAEVSSLSYIIETLGENPLSLANRLSDSGLWRIRAGRYRMVCAIDDCSRTVTLLNIAARNNGAGY